VGSAPFGAQSEGGQTGGGVVAARFCAVETRPHPVDRIGSDAKRVLQKVQPGRGRENQFQEEPMADAARNLEVAQPKQYQASQLTWDKIADSKEFKDLMATKKTFIVPAFIFFVVYYFALPVLVGYAPQFMSTKVIGQVNLAYLFALSQFFVAWIIAGLYIKAANNFDRLAKDILEKAEDAKGGN
jgi:uncharacterized membrane protein (DUF485 family)